MPDETQASEPYVICTGCGYVNNLSIKLELISGDYVMRKAIFAAAAAILMGITQVGQPVWAAQSEKDKERTGTESGANTGGGLTSAPFIGDGMNGNDDFSFESDANDGFFIGGVQLGYDYVENGILYGVEADINILNANASDTTRVFPNNRPYIFRSDVSADWLSTVRLRFGTYVDETLIYMTAGLAVAELDVEQTVSGTITGRTKRSKVKVGFAIGAGAEFPLTSDITLRGEYLYAQFGPVRADYVDDSGRIPIAYKAEGLGLHILRTAINFKF